MEGQPEKHLNTFQKGQVKDIDALQLASDSYTNSYGGRVIFNEDGTYAWENANGTKFSFNLDANYGQNTDYVPTGGWQINGKLVIFSNNGSNSEIGLVYEPQFGTYSYQTIYNDLYDPYGGKLNFSALYQMRDCQVVVENDKVERIYFNDDFNEPRTLNVLLGLTAISPEFSSGNYLPIGGATVGNVYPDFYSVHGMADMVDLTWGKLKFNRNITGQLLSGEYQYAYRLIHRTGYVSPWSPLSANILLTTDLVSNNWTTYQMQQSGAQTAKGIELEIKYLDERFQQVEVAALYWKTSAAPNNAYTFFKGAITGSSIIVPHQFAGAAITVDELVQRYTEIKKAKTGGLKDNTYHIANFETFPNVEIDATLITVTPTVRPMLSDEYTNEVANTFAPPFTNQTPKLNAVTENMANGLPETYSIYNDYINYKGTQWTALFQNYFGGETYPFAFVLFDRKGQPCFAQHIADFTFPQRYSNEWVDKRLVNGVEVITTGTTGAVGDYKHTSNASGTMITDGGGVYPAIYNLTATGGNAWFLNLMGANFSGIDLEGVLYDAGGNLQVSGFCIARTERIKSILAQGIVMSNGASVKFKNPVLGTDPTQQMGNLPTMFNGYIESNGAAYAAIYSGVNAKYVGKAPNRYDGAALPSVSQLLYPSPKYTSRSQNSFFESPDYLIDNTILGNNIAGDNMKVVGVCVKSYGDNSLDGQSPYNLQFESFYQKNYRTVIDNSKILTQYNTASGTYDLVQVGDPVDIIYWYPNIQSGTTIFGNREYVTTIPTLDYLGWGNKRYLTRRIEPACLFTYGYTPATNKVVDYLGVLTDDEAGNVGYGHGAYMIANYVRPTGQYNITESLLQSRLYNGIGHFVPINQTIIDAVRAQDPNGRCVFNNVKVWGGDCYLDYFTYYRLYADLDEVNSDNQDYNIGLSFPIESAFNIALRQGNTYERFGGTTADTYNSGGTLFPDGLYYFDNDAHKPEDFNVNKVLQPVPQVGFAYAPKPVSFDAIYDYPMREQYTGTKIYGEKYDAYRRFPVNNFKDADGSKGEINSLQNIFNYLYIIQRSGFARVRFNDRESIVGSTGSPLDIGTGLGLRGFDYISNVYGTQHQFSVINTGRMLHFLDAERGKHNRFAADGMLSPSDTYGHHNYFTKKLREYWTIKDPNNLLLPAGDKPYYDNPCYLGGIASVFDYVNQSVYYTFTQRKESQGGVIITTGTAETIEYNEGSNQYKGFQPFTPKVYFNFKESYLSPDPVTPYKIYTHDEGVVGHVYGAYYDSSVRFIVNPKTMVAKWFDNVSLALNNQAASVKVKTISGEVPDIGTQVVTLATDTRWRYLQGFLRAPLRAVNAVSRLRGKACTVEITVLNDASNTKVRISNVMTDYRISPKI